MLKKGIAVPGDGLDAEDPEGEQNGEIEDDIEHVAEEPGEGPTEEGPEERADDDTTPAPAELEVSLSPPVFLMPIHALMSSVCQSQEPLLDKPSLRYSAGKRYL